MNGEAVVPEPAAAASSPAQASPSPPEWRFSQVFGERSAGEEVQDGKTIHRLSPLGPSRRRGFFLNFFGALWVLLAAGS